jgi:hypothetical protein
VVFYSLPFQKCSISSHGKKFINKLDSQTLLKTGYITAVLGLKLARSQENPAIN